MPPYGSPPARTLGSLRPPSFWNPFSDEAAAAAPAAPAPVPAAEDADVLLRDCCCCCCDGGGCWSECRILPKMGATAARNGKRLDRCEVCVIDPEGGKASRSSSRFRCLFNNHKIASNMKTRPARPPTTPPTILGVGKGPESEPEPGEPPPGPESEPDPEPDAELLPSPPAEVGEAPLAPAPVSEELDPVAVGEPEDNRVVVVGRVKDEKAVKEDEKEFDELVVGRVEKVEDSVDVKVPFMICSVAVVVDVPVEF